MNSENEFNRDKLVSALKRITDVVEKINEKQDTMNESVVRSETLVTIQQRQYEKLENTLDKTVSVLDSVACKVEILTKVTEPHTEKIEALEKHTYAFKSIPLVLKFIILLITVFTSSYGVYAMIASRL